MSNTFKKVIDRQMWVQVAPSPNAHAAGMGLSGDIRGTILRNPYAYQLASATVLNRFNIVTKSWQAMASVGLAGTFGAGAGCVFAPSLGLIGSIGAGCSTTSIVTTTVQTSMGANTLASRGGSGDYGFRIRIIGSAAGSSGKVEERWIIANTAGTTPTIILDEPLTFTPASGDKYEIVAGRVFMLNAGTTASNIWRSFEVAANTLSSGLSTTGLPATISTDFAKVALDEQYVPYDAIPGEGFLQGVGTYDANEVKRCLIATATGAGTITGQATGGDSAVLANEYRNFQVRIVEDTAIPTAVGQRRVIASHTQGTSPVYTLGAAWTVTPSSTAKFVIELPNLILIRSTATTTVYTYNYSADANNNGTTNLAANSWSTTYYGSAPAAHAAGCFWAPSFGIRPDIQKNARHSHIWCFRGGNTVTADVLDIAGGVNGSWASAQAYDGNTSNFTTGSCGAYAPFGDEGRFTYINGYVASAVNQIYRFDVKNRVLQPYTPTDWVQAGTAAAGDRMTCFAAIDGSDVYVFVLLVAHTSTVAQELIVLI